MQYGPKITTNGLVLALDAADMNSYSPNVFPYPVNPFAWSGTGGNNITTSADTTVVRQAGFIPLKMVMTGADPYTGTYNTSGNNLAPAANGQTWTLSFYAKASETVTGNCFIFGANSSGNYIEAPATSFTVTTSWQRFTFTTTFSNASTAYIQMRLGGSSGQVGKIIWWDSIQLERSSTATTFNPYYFGNTIWKDVSGNNRIGTLTNGPLFNSSNSGNIIFDGSNDYSIIPSGGSYSEYTFMFFCKWITDTANGSRLFGCDGFGTYTIFTPSNVAFHYNQVAGSTTVLSSGVNVGLGTWCHVAVTVSMSSPLTSIYINGALKNTTTVGPYINLSGNLYLGAQYSSTLFANCNIASFQLYNRVLSAVEITRNYNASKIRFGL